MKQVKVLSTGMLLLVKKRGISMFILNEKVVYPGHGVAQIYRIIEKKVAGVSTQFFELKFINKEMTVLVPISNASAVGIRRLSSDRNIQAMFEMLSEPMLETHHESVASNWNKRSKGYQFKIRSGDIAQICKIYRDLKHISMKKELSFGEKNLLQQTEALLAEEISLVMAVSEERAIEYLRSLFRQLGSPDLSKPPHSQIMPTSI